MTYSCETLTRAVRVLMDEDPTTSSLMREGDADTLQLDAIIREQIPRAAAEVMMAAPVHLLEGGHSFGSTLFFTSDRCGYTLLPADFLRLVVFEMSDWERPVFSAVSSDSAEYAQLRSRFPGISGNPERPACALAPSPQGLRLEFYGTLSRTATATQALYAPWPRWDADSCIDLPEKLYSDITERAAGRVLDTLGMRAAPQGN